MSTIRHRTLAVALAAATTLGLTACQDSAPTVAAPSSTSTSSSPSSSSSETSTTQSSTTESSTSSESSTTSETSSSSGSEQPGQCYDSVSLYWSKKGSGTQVKPAGSAVTTDARSGAKLEITPSKGQVKDGGSSYPYEDGKQALLFDIKFKLTDTSGYAVLSYLQWSLSDDKGNNCRRDSGGSSPVIDKQISVVSLNEQKTEFQGQVAFVVPKGKDYSKYTLLFSYDTEDGNEAKVGWAG
ncbi:hypothetical protein [Yimella sp. cx-51]|uniref:hypothetical protein n=1 Tax=Yimella sp. cx-51 TaxID=2770551 RepID=UPI00165D3BBE|nr:hypothetical protein [Yimella sp. cx-51]MBC9957248.1 hypothetical protein [Yimella sp. cx-51]QTH37109.1 hypothetical protein J5M86_09320 [Yimella sp. cx-51]